MVNCAVHGCYNVYKKGRSVSYYKLPFVSSTYDLETAAIVEKRRLAWLAVLNRKNINEKYTFVCQKHFKSGKPAYFRDVTDVDWCPSLHMKSAGTPGAGAAEIALAVQEERHKRRVKRNKSNLNKTLNKNSPIKTASSSVQVYENVEVEHDEVGVTGQDMFFDCLNDSNFLNVGSNEHDYANTNYSPTKMNKNNECIKRVEPEIFAASSNVCDVGCQTDMTWNDIEKITENLEAVVTENSNLKKDVLENANFTEEMLSKDDKMVHFYTGLPSFALLLAVYKYVETSVSFTHRNKLTKFEEMMLVLIRLRLHVPLQDLAYRFKISQATASRIFHKWISVMEFKLSYAVAWPDRENLQKTMPGSFRRAFGDKVAVIIDCFEVFVIRPAGLLARALTWSQYKHHNTIKFLIGITPRGVISFISKAWGGRVSDKHLTENCGFLDKLKDEDVVMADRGFNIQDTLSQKSASLLIPAFMKGRSQLSMVDAETSRKISNLRIHVERVIGVVRSKYRILSGTLPIELLVSKDGSDPLVDKIGVVCCALTNLCPSVVSDA